MPLWFRGDEAARNSPRSPIRGRIAEIKMTNGRPRRRSIFSGLILIIIGLVLLTHTLRGDFRLLELLSRWWPLLLIIWGLAKLYDHLAARRTGQPTSPTITGGEIFLVLVLVAIVAAAGFVDRAHRDLNIDTEDIVIGQRYSFSDELPAQAVAPDAAVSVNTDRGDVAVYGDESTNEMRVAAKKTATAWDESQAEQRARQVRAAIVKAGEGYEVRLEGQDSTKGRVRVDLEIHLPKKVNLTARTGRGDVEVNELTGAVSVNTGKGNLTIRDVVGDVSAELRSGDVNLSGVKGNVKVSGRGGDVEIAEVEGQAVLDGEFFGTVRMSKVTQGARFISQRTDLTVTRLAGQVETGSGQMEISDVPGNISLTTREKDISLENITGRVRIENRSGNVTLRLSQPPRDDIEITNQSGNIELTLSPRSAFEIQAEARSGEIESEFDEPALQVNKDQRGNSTLAGKLGARGPQIRLKTTYGTITLRKGK